jgi:hypothetical protein
MLGRSTADTRHRRWLVWTALCLFALRALVPIGFMVSLEASHAAVTLCPDYGPVPPAVAAQHAHHHAQGAAHGTGDDGAGSTAHPPGAESHGLCPFAAAAHGGWHGLKPVFALPAPDLQQQLEAFAADAAVPRLHLSFSRSPRGPPALNLG